MKNLQKFLLFSLVLSAFNPTLQAEEKSFFQIIIGFFSGSNDNNDAHDNNNAQADRDVAFAKADQEQYSNNYKEVDYSSVRQEFRSAFNRVLAKPHQTQADQNEIQRVCEKSSNQVIQILQTQFGNLSEQQSKYKACELAREAAVQFVGDRTEQIVHHEILRIRRNPPINPTHLQPIDREYLIKWIKQEMLHEAGNRVSNQDGSLREYAGEQLRRKVAFKVEQAFGIHERQAQTVNYNQDPYAHLPASQRPSAPPVNAPGS